LKEVEDGVDEAALDRVQKYISSVYLKNKKSKLKTDLSNPLPGPSLREEKTREAGVPNFYIYCSSRRRFA
jgi:hypothetical protein